MSDGESNLFNGQLFDIVIDKGTYDAISLNAEVIEMRKNGVDPYVRKVRRFCKDGAYFIITSCNWTKDELIDNFKEGKQSRLLIKCRHCEFFLLALGFDGPWTNS